MTRYATRDCDCPPVITGVGGKRPEECPCGNRYQTDKELSRLHPAPADEGDDRASRPGRPVVDPSDGGAYKAGRRRRTKPLKRSSGFATSPEQQKATKGRACIVCGKDEAEATIDPAHVTPRRMAPLCTCEKGTVPLCRRCHTRYDDLSDPFDLLPYLMAHGLHEETVHGFLEHGVSLREQMDVVTGAKWAPKELAA